MSNQVSKMLVRLQLPLHDLQLSTSFCFPQNLNLVTYHDGLCTGSDGGGGGSKLGEFVMEAACRYHDFHASTYANMWPSAAFGHTNTVTETDQKQNQLLDVYLLLIYVSAFVRVVYFTLEAFPRISGMWMAGKYRNTERVLIFRYLLSFWYCRAAAAVTPPSILCNEHSWFFIWSGTSIFSAPIGGKHEVPVAARCCIPKGGRKGLRKVPGGRDMNE